MPSTEPLCEGRSIGRQKEPLSLRKLRKRTMCTSDKPRLSRNFVVPYIYSTQRLTGCLGRTVGKWLSLAIPSPGSELSDGGGQIQTNEVQWLRPKVGGVEQERILSTVRLPIWTERARQPDSGSSAQARPQRPGLSWDFWIKFHGPLVLGWMALR